MRLSSLRVKVIGVVALCLFLAALGILTVIQASFASQTDRMTRDAIVQARQAFLELEQTEIGKLSAVLEAILTSDAYAGSYTDSHRQELYANAKPLFERLRTQYQFTLWQYNNRERQGTVYLRIHNPTQFGDPLERSMYERCVRTKQLVAGKELGHSGFALRVMMPQRDRQGQILGYVEVGEQIGHFFGRMQTQTGNQYGLALKKALLQPDKWADFRKSRGERDNWNDLDTIVAADRTLEDNRLMDIHLDIDSLPPDGEALGQTSIGSNKYVRGVFPIFSVDGQRSGAIFVAKDMTRSFADLRALEIKVIVMIVGVVVLISVVVGFMLNSFVFRRLDNMIEVATRVVGGDYECEIRKSADDEIGDFEHLFDQFRKVFLRVVKAHS